jgi:hypothetical protein
MKLNVGDLVFCRGSIYFIRGIYLICEILDPCEEMMMMEIEIKFDRNIWKDDEEFTSVWINISEEDLEEPTPLFTLITPKGKENA